MPDVENVLIESGSVRITAQYVCPPSPTPVYGWLLECLSQLLTLSTAEALAQARAIMDICRENMSVQR